MKAVYGEVTEVKKIVSRQVARVHIEIPVEAFKESVQLLDDQRVLVTLAPGVLANVPFGVVDAGDVDTEQVEQTHDPEPTFGDYAKALHTSGWFLNPKVCAALGSDKEYREWIKRQPSAVSGEFDYIELTHGGGLEPRCVPHHLLRAEAPPAREGEYPNKPSYFCVPLRDREHKFLHEKSEHECMSNFGGVQCTADTARAYFDKKRAELLIEWCKSKLYERFHVDSLRELSPDLLVTWAEAHGIEGTLPRIFRESMA